MKTFKKICQWVWYSSVNANNLSLTVKSFLYGIVPSILFFANIIHLQLDSKILTQIIDTIAQAIVYVGGAITAVGFLFGLIRKLLNTIAGENDVIASWSDYRK